MFAIPGIFLFSAPKAGVTVDVSYLQGITMAVVPLTDVTGGGDQSAGFSSLLFSELDQLKVLRMVPSAKIKTSLINAGVSPGFEADFSQILKAGQNAGADLVVTGTINNYLMLNKNTSAISMSIYAINVHTGKTIWSDNLTRSFEKTKFIDEGARLACTLAIKRMVEGLEKEKTAMRQSIYLTSTSTNTSKGNNNQQSSLKQQPLYTAGHNTTSVSLDHQSKNQVKPSENSNLKSADALLQELLGNSSPSDNSIKQANMSKSVKNADEIRSNSNQNNGVTTAYEQATHLATDIAKGINNHRKQINSSTNNQPEDTNRFSDISRNNLDLKNKTATTSFNHKDYASSKKEQETTRIKLGTVYFASGSAQIDFEATNDIEEVLAAINANPLVPLIIEGHTDNSGTPSYNSYLAHARSNALKQYLTSKGVNKSRMVTFGFSAKAPVTPNVTEEAMNLNRRAVVYACPEADRMNCGDYWNKTEPVPDSTMVSSKTNKTVANKKLYKYSAKETQTEDSDETNQNQNKVESTKAEKNTITTSEILENMREKRLAKSDAPLHQPTKTQSPQIVNNNKNPKIRNIDEYIARASKKLAEMANQPIDRGDALRVKVTGHDELDKQVLIPPSGMFSYNLISDFNVVGLSPQEMEKKVALKLGTYILNAQVNIKRIHIIKVLGETKQNGQFEFSYEPSILDVLTKAGGMTKLKDTHTNYRARIVTRKGDIYEIDISSILKSGINSNAIKLFHGDTLLITPEERENVYVISSSNVSILFRRGMRLLDALSYATGGTGGSKDYDRGIKAEEIVNIKNVRILRKTRDGHIMKIIVNVHDIIHQGKTDRNIKLCAGDYIVIPRRSKRKDPISVINDAVSPLYQTIGLYSLVNNLD